MTRRHRDHADQLERVLDGSLSVDAAPRDVARLAGLASTVTATATVAAPDPRFRAELRSQLLGAATEARTTWADRVRDQVDERTARWRYSTRLAAATTLASTMLGTTGVAAAAQQALPGDVLYRVKLFTEDVQLAFASGDAEKGRLHLAFARERLDEVHLGLPRLSDAEIATTLNTMDADSAVGAEELLVAAQQDEPAEILSELQTFTVDQTAAVTALIRELPLGAVPAAEQSLEVLRRIEVQVQGLLDDVGCEVCGNTAAADADGPRVLLPGQGPAVDGCDCATGTAPETPREAGAEAPTTSDEPAETDRPVDSPTATPTAPPGPSEDPTSVRLLVPELPDPLDGAGAAIDDVLDGILGDTSLSEPVDGLGDTLDTTVDELGETVDSVLDPLLGDSSSSTSPSTPTSSPSPTATTDGLIDGLLGD